MQAIPFLQSGAGGEAKWSFVAAEKIAHLIREPLGTIKFAVDFFSLSSPSLFYHSFPRALSVQSITPSFGESGKKVLVTHISRRRRKSWRNSQTSDPECAFLQPQSNVPDEFLVQELALSLWSNSGDVEIKEIGGE